MSSSNFADQKSLINDTLVAELPKFFYVLELIEKYSNAFLAT